MDIFAHTLWTAALAKGANTNKKVIEKNTKPLRVGWAAFFGVAPDLFAFSPVFFVAFFMLISGKISFGEFGNHHGLSALEAMPSWLDPSGLYHISHSVVIFLAVFLVVWAIRRRPYYEMMGWLLHILIDIPSHAASFYPTPFLWPLSDYRFLHGVSWANPTYMIINYSLLVIVWVYFLVKRKKVQEKTSL